MWAGSSMLTQHEAVDGHFDIVIFLFKEKGRSISQITSHSEVALTVTVEANGEHKYIWVVWSKAVILSVVFRLNGGC